MDITTIAKAANLTLATSAIALIGINAYCQKKQKEIDDLIYSKDSFVKGGVRFRIVKVPSDI